LLTIVKLLIFGLFVLAKGMNLALDCEEEAQLREKVK
jgi:hypothetical protein